MLLYATELSPSIIPIIGLCGFDNPHRDQKTEEVRRHIGQRDNYLRSWISRRRTNTNDAATHDTDTPSTDER
ncbi:hypothetical protein HF086_015895 [Spodoptera exigua]|uniref:Uncharacterized protein n=1 Tax=Spodoptera exigua TaxID=7107 RepID=A0A922M1Y4_SPOEX|nr:hypothetical protein HF086_015895 [Spodoptera exigua]